MGKNKSIIAVLMIFLVLSLPLYSSFVFASNIKEIRAYGQHGYDGFVKGYNDFITIEADIAVDFEEEVTTNDVVIRFDNNFDIKFSDPFCTYSSCSLKPQTPQDPNTYNCVCQTSWSLSGEDKINFVVKHESSSMPKDVMRDIKPPVISSMELSQDDDKLKLNYILIDYACDGCSGKCVGLKAITLSDDNGWSHSVDLDRQPSDPCAVSGIEFFSYNNDGNQNFRLKVVDNFWDDFQDDELHSSQMTKSFVTDFTDPSVSEGFYFQKDNQEINFASYDTIIGDLSVLVSDLYFKEATLLAKYGNNEKTINTCVDLGDYVYNCTFENTKIKLSEPETTASFEISVKDQSGNIALTEISKSFVIDNVKPEISFMGSLRYDSIVEKSYINKSGGSLLMTFVEEGSGFYAKQVWLNTNAFNNNPFSQATDCYPIQEGWACIWEDITLSSNRAEGSSLSLSRTNPSGKISSDDAGNPIQGMESTFVTFDSEKPIVNNVTTLSITEMGLLEFHKTGDSLLILLNATDEHSRVYGAVANFTELYGYEDSSIENVEALCERYDDYTLCQWETESITTGWKVVKVPITVYDFAGNSKKEDKEIEIFNPHGDVPDCYGLEIGDILPIEYTTAKSLVTLYYQTIPISLKTKGCGGDLFNLELIGSCGGGGSVFTVKNDDNYYGFIQIPIDPTQIVDIFDGGNTKLTIGGNEENSCALIFYVTGRRNVYTTPELENVSIEIPIRNNLRPAGSEMKDEIDTILDSYESYGKIIVNAEKVVSLSENICSIRTVINNIKAVFNAIRLVGVTLKLVAVTKPAGEILETTSGRSWEGINNALSKLDKTLFSPYCAFITCDNKKDNGKFVFPGGVLPLVYDTVKDLWEKIGLKDIINKLEIFPEDSNIPLTFPASPMELAKSDIIFASAGLCIPAIIYHLNKRMQLECWRGQCYMTLVPAGVPKNECDQQYSYQKCIYWSSGIGTILKALGIDRIGDVVNNLISNPTTTAWVIAKNTLKLGCKKPQSTVTYYLTCLPHQIMDLTENVLTAYSSVENFIKGFDWDNIGQPDFCEKLLEMVEEDETWHNDGVEREDTITDDGDF